MEKSEVTKIVEGALFAAGRPLSVTELGNLFDQRGRPDNKLLRESLKSLAEEYENRAVELKEVGSGFRFQVRSEFGQWVSRLWEEKPPRYSRALLETLSLIAYRQPITRGEVEEVRGVAVSTQIIRTLLERNWVKVVGHRDAPGKPALYSTTKEFLDNFNIKSLKELPPLAEINEIAMINPELDLAEPAPEIRSLELPNDDAVAATDETNGEVTDSDTSSSDAADGEAAESAVADSATDTVAEGSDEAVSTTQPSVPDPDQVDPDADFDGLPN